jgi:hypothetical protein
MRASVSFSSERCVPASNRLNEWIVSPSNSTRSGSFQPTGHTSRDAAAPRAMADRLHLGEALVAQEHEALDQPLGCDLLAGPERQHRARELRRPRHLLSTTADRGHHDAPSRRSRAAPACRAARAVTDGCGDDGS